jgi:hypothetical protein
LDFDSKLCRDNEFHLLSHEHFQNAAKLDLEGRVYNFHYNLYQSS